MMQEKKRLIFKTARVILDDGLFEKLLREGGYGAITAISYHKLGFAKDLPVKEKKTSVISLREGLEEVFKKFNETARRYIRRARENQDLAFVSDDKNFERLYRMYKKFEHSKGRAPLRRDSFWGCKFFSAYLRREPISVIAVYDSPPYLRIRSLYSKRLDTEDKKFYTLISAATRNLVYEICRYGVENGYKSLDMASVNFTNPETKSIAEFKTSFGGEIISEFTYKFRSPAFRAFEKLGRFKAGLSRFLLRR